MLHVKKYTTMLKNLFSEYFDKMICISDNKDIKHHMKLFSDLAIDISHMIPGIGIVKAGTLISLASLTGFLQLGYYVNHPIHNQGGPKMFISRDMGFKAASNPELLLNWNVEITEKYRTLFNNELTPNMLENASCILGRGKKGKDLFYFLPWYDRQNQTFTKDNFQLCFRVVGERLHNWQLVAFDGVNNVVVISKNGHIDYNWYDQVFNNSSDNFLSVESSQSSVASSSQSSVQSSQPSIAVAVAVAAAATIASSKSSAEETAIASSHSSTRRAAEIAVVVASSQSSAAESAAKSSNTSSVAETGAIASSQSSTRTAVASSQSSTRRAVAVASSQSSAVASSQLGYLSRPLASDTIYLSSDSSDNEIRFTLRTHRSNRRRNRTSASSITSRDTQPRGVQVQYEQLDRYYAQYIQCREETESRQNNFQSNYTHIQQIRAYNPWVQNSQSYNNRLHPITVFQVTMIQLFR